MLKQNTSVPFLFTFLEFVIRQSRHLQCIILTINRRYGHKLWSCMGLCCLPLFDAATRTCWLAPVSASKLLLLLFGLLLFCARVCIAAVPGPPILSQLVLSFRQLADAIKAKRLLVAASRRPLRW